MPQINLVIRFQPDIICLHDDGLRGEATGNIINIATINIVRFLREEEPELLMH